MPRPLTSTRARRLLAEPGARELGERVLRAVSRAAHQDAAADGDEEVLLAPATQVERALGGGNGSEGFPGERHE